MASSEITTVEKYIETFPIPTLTKIVGQPNYENIKDLNEELNANAASIVSTRGGGAHGHLALTVSPTVYATLSAEPYVAPTMPEAIDPAALVGRTGPQIAEINRLYAAQKAEFHSYVNLQNALKKQVVAAVEPIFLQAIREAYVGFANRTVFDLLRHLYDGYAAISADDLEHNDKRLREQWDPNTPFATLIKQITDATDLADHAGVPYTAEQTVSAAYTLVERTGVLEADCKKWREKPAAQQTRANFQTFFRDAHKDWEKYAKRYGATARYGQAHLARSSDQQYDDSTITALANFATSTATDRATLSKLSDTVQELTAELKVARAKIDDLKKQLANEKTKKNGGKENKNPNSNRKFYCHSCGFSVDHPSNQCPNPKEGHCNEATCHDIKDGSTHRLSEFLAYMPKKGKFKQMK